MDIGFFILKRIIEVKISYFRSLIYFDIRKQPIKKSNYKLT